MAQKIDPCKLPVSQTEDLQEHRKEKTFLIDVWLAHHQLHIPTVGEIGHSKQWSYSENLSYPAFFLLLLFLWIQYFLQILIAYPIHTWTITLRMLLTLRVKSADCQQICKLASPSISKDCGALLLLHSDNDPLKSSKSVPELLDLQQNKYQSGKSCEMIFQNKRSNFCISYI